jgi:hypothetical protein
MGRSNTSEPKLEIPNIKPPEQTSEPAPDSASQTVVMPLPDSTTRTLVSYLIQPGAHKALRAYMQANPSKNVARYLIEYESPTLGNGKGESSSGDRAAANAQWLKFYDEMRRAGLGGSFGTGLDGTPPFKD